MPKRGIAPLLYGGAMRLLCLSAIATLIGCASVKHVSAPRETDDTDRGIRYYETSPYLLVYPRPGEVVTEILHLPDPTRRRSAHIRAWGGARIRTALSFDKGCLVSSHDETLSSAPPAALLKAVQGVLPLLALMNVPQDETAVPAPSLYKFVSDDQGGLHLYGTPGTNTVWLSLTTAGGGQP